ncbi:hypothetical protein N0B44_32205 [Roseibacterium beibuensis]|uniref:hypothetical protein n=1 Tax=[Roseibacterium] beibuensis TaxID=1193142 RepID=UPI00217CCD91|nr:hypothetical protein [Roseibacterium beibuensis]MCS6627577.1 hypothetical protein [Roseibacterium beibuensis]
MKSNIVVVALAAALGLAACGDIGTGREPPPPPGPPVPPSPDLPMTAAKARLIMGTLSNTCMELATLKYDIHACDLKQGRASDEEALRTELRDLRWNLDKLTRDEASAQCAAQTNELRKTPKPAVCW